jgi:DNA gyrase subunit A
MYKMNLLGGNRTKSANVVGQTMKLNPHGDMAIYETLVRLTRGNEALLHPYIDSKGNFGKQYSRDMAFAAPRYTEVMLDRLAGELFGDIDKETVDFTDNYDGTMKEPVLLPSTFPTVLVNANQGIAVGMASNIASFNLKEICEATIRLLKNPKAKLTDKILGPDFPTGGDALYNGELMKNIIENGRGTFKIRGRYRYDKKNSMVEIYEIPYTTTIEAIIDSIAILVKTGKIKEIVDVRDETDLKGLKIAIEIKKSSDPDLLMKKLFKTTSQFKCAYQRETVRAWRKGHTQRMDNIQDGMRKEKDRIYAAAEKRQAPSP